MELQLTDIEAAALRDLLHTHLGDMSSEIAHTDNPAFRQGLRDTRDALKAVYARLGGAAAGG